MVDARLHDGSRVNAIVPPLSLDGPILTIRKFAKEPYQAADLIGMHTFSEEVATLLASAVEGGLNVLVSGGTGTGKTTMLNVLSSFVSAEERIVTIEDAVELQLHQEHVIRLEARPPNMEGQGEVTIRDLVRNSPAHAARPHHRRRGPRRRGPGHAPGHEHRPRRLALHGPRQHAPRCPEPASRRWC